MNVFHFVKNTFFYGNKFKGTPGWGDYEVNLFQKCSSFAQCEISKNVRVWVHKLDLKMSTIMTVKMIVQCDWKKNKQLRSLRFSRTEGKKTTTTTTVTFVHPAYFFLYWQLYLFLIVNMKQTWFIFFVPKQNNTDPVRKNKTKQNRKAVNEWIKNISTIYKLMRNKWSMVSVMSKIDKHFCLFLENEPSVYDLQSSGGSPPVGGFIYRGCQSRRLYGSYVFGNKNG